MWRARPELWSLLLAAVLLLSGCSLISIKEPGKPLSAGELNARLLTRDYSDHFQNAVVRAADDIASNSPDPAVQLAALQWKIRATAASRRAATQMAPMLGLLDSWALSAQMREFLADGAGSQLFGPQQSIARAVATALEDDVVAMARRVTTPRQFTVYQKFVADYVRDDPLQNTEFARASVVERWSAQTKEHTTLISGVGTVPQALSDFGDRLRLYADHVPAETLWRTQLAVHQEGDSQDWPVMMREINESLSDIGQLATASPDLLRESMSDLRQTLIGTTERLHRSGIDMIEELGAEREALAENVEHERVGVVQALDQQRLAMTKDMGRIAGEVTETSWRELRALLRELAVYAITALILVLGLPFAAGYLLGRARARDSR
jgi:hypothetical protein